MLSGVQLFVTPPTLACQAALSMGFPRQEYWSGLPFPPPGDLPDPRIKSVSPALAGRLFTPEPLEQVVDKGLVSLFPPPLYECPIVSASFVKKGYFSSIELLLCLVKNRLNIVILVYFSTLRSFVLLIFHGASPVAQVSVSQILVNTCKPFFNYSYCGHHHYYHHHYN